MIKSYSPGAPDFSPVLIILVVILLFLIFRALVLWYWKVNKIVSLLEDIKKNTSPAKSEYEKVATDRPSRKSISDLLKTEIKI